MSNLKRRFIRRFRKVNDSILQTLGVSLTTSKPSIKFVETNFGKFYVISNDALSKHIASEDLHEPHFYQLTKLLLKETDNVLDLGANLGSHTIWMSRIVYKGKVFSFEPLSLTYSQLQLNLLANKITNVASYKLALSNATGEYLRMEPIDYDKEDINIGATRVSSVGNGDGVLSVKLDDIDLPSISFIKMDIQGSEYVALLGMKKLNDRDRPIIFIEIEEPHLEACGSSSKQLIEHLFSLNYTLFRIKTDYPCDHLAVPHEKCSIVEATVVQNCSYPTDKLQGKEIELFFSNGDDTYSSFTVR